MGGGAAAQALEHRRDEERQFEPRDRAEQIARGLGLFSLGLGIAQLLAPRKVARIALGRDDRRQRDAMRTIGVRELACGLGILTRRRPSGWLWTRVLGDAMDLYLLGRSLGSRRADRACTLRSMGAVLGVAALDLATSVQLSRTNRVQARVGKGLLVTRSISVNRPPDEVYRFWRNFQNLPRFMAHLESVQVRDERRSRWVALGPARKAVAWDAEITEDRPNEIISWRSLEGSDVPNWGSVRFQRAPGGRGTEIHLDLRYDPPGGILGVTVAKLFGKAPEQQVEGDLRRFKQVIETGEVLHSDTSIHRGRHPARPPERRPSNGKGANR
jgi:uncharacterized membrane protein